MEVLMLFMLLLVFAGYAVHPDPLIGVFIICGWAMGVMLLISAPLWIWERINRKKWAAQREAELKLKYPNLRPLSDLLKELENGTFALPPTEVDLKQFGDKLLEEPIKKQRNKKNNRKTKKTTSSKRQVLRTVKQTRQVKAGTKRNRA